MVLSTLGLLALIAFVVLTQFVWPALLYIVLGTSLVGGLILVLLSARRPRHQN